MSLSEVLQRVAQSNRDVLAAQRAIDAAKADEVASGVTPAPQFSVMAQSIDTHAVGHGTPWQHPVDTIARIDKTFERGDKPGLRRQGAQAAAKAAGHDAADALRQQRIAAAQAYWDVKLAQDQVAIAERNLRVASDGSESAKTRLAQGDISRLEATRMAVETDRASNEVSQARLQLAQARLALAKCLALEQVPPLRAADDWPSLDEAMAQGMLADPQEADGALDRRADVAAAAARLEQARSAVALAQAQRKADVTWSVQFEHNPGVGDRLWGIGLAFPLGVDDRQQGPIAKALVAQADAQAQWESVKAAAYAEQRLQRDTLLLALERLKRLEDKVLPMARQALDAAQYARQQGAIGLQDLLDARRALHAVEQDAAAAHADAAKAWWALKLTREQETVRP